MTPRLSSYILSGCLLVAGIIHLLPLTGVAGTDQLASLYGVEITDANLEIMMRHRAILFGLLGAVLLVAGFHRPLQRGAIAAGLVSASSFLWLAESSGGYNSELTRVVIADIVALIALVVAALLYGLRAKSRNAMA